MMRLSAGFVIALHDMPPARLAELVDGLRPARPIPLAELMERKKAARSNAGLFAITVDDGVGDNVRGLAGLFRARQWPATFYLPTRYMDTGDPMAFQWWLRVKPLLPRRKLDLPSGAVDLSRPGAIEKLSRKVEAMWYSGRMECYLPLTLDLVDAVARETGMSRQELRSPAPISWPEVEQLSRDSLIQFESHGVTHAAMCGLSEEEIAFEMRHSRDTIEEHTGRPCRHLCYPFGSPLAIGTLAPRLAPRFYDSAVTMSLGPIDNADPWLIPRIPFYPKNSLLFARLKVMLHCCRIGRARTAETTEAGLACIPKP
jgi:peptidoglycan/xylan/chitin deacetylase (PgdA/CDA1 family)